MGEKHAKGFSLSLLEIKTSARRFSCRARESSATGGDGGMPWEFWNWCCRTAGENDDGSRRQNPKPVVLFARLFRDPTKERKLENKNLSIS
jgi:hypothetical protein